MPHPKPAWPPSPSHLPRRWRPRASRSTPLPRVSSKRKCSALFLRRSVPSCSSKFPCGVLGGPRKWLGPVCISVLPMATTLLAQSCPLMAGYICDALPGVTRFHPRDLCISCASVLQFCLVGAASLPWSEHLCARYASRDHGNPQDTVGGGVWLIP